jgi:hypothetical protein
LNPQPPVAVGVPLCYVSGPSTPEIKKPDVPATGFSSAQLDGSVYLGFVPDGQWNYFGNSPDITFDQVQCAKPIETVDSNFQSDYNDKQWIFADAQDCTVPFHIMKPQKGATYTVTAQVWNSSAVPVPQMTDDVKLPDVTKTIQMGTCGGVTEECCEGGKCDDDATEMCNHTTNKCEACGAPTQQCCPGVTPCVNSLTSPSVYSCQNGLCKECGLDNQRCCDDPLYRKCHQAFHTCQSGTCSPCGGPGQPCCSGGTDCQVSSTNACNSQVIQGGNNPETHLIPLPKTSGTLTLSLNTYDVPDVITVSWPGGMVSTGCYGSRQVASAGCIPVPGNDCCIPSPATPCCAPAVGSPPSEVCCSDTAGDCSITFSYSGADSMTVDVAPNCNASSPTTEWEFMLSCP